MSWDILLMKEKFSFDDVPDDYQPKPLGKRDYIIERLLSVIPELDYQDKS